MWNFSDYSFIISMTIHVHQEFLSLTAQIHCICSVLSQKDYSPPCTSIINVNPCAMESQCRRQKGDSACKIFKENFEHALQKGSLPVCLVLG